MEIMDVIVCPYMGDNFGIDCLYKLVYEANKYIFLEICFSTTGGGGWIVIQMYVLSALVVVVSDGRNLRIPGQGAGAESK